MTSEEEKMKLINALSQIATGIIVGEERNYRDTLSIVRKVARDTLEEFGYKV